MSEHDPKDGRKTTAYILLGLAAYILLSNIGLLDFIGIGSVISWAWDTMFSLIPVGVLGVGIYWLTQAESGQRPLIPWVLTLFGAILLISQFNLFGIDFGDLFWPMWFVVIAIVMLNPRKILPKHMNVRDVESLESQEGENEKLYLVAFMGGGELNFTTQALIGGEVLNFMGGYKLDFSEAEMKDDSMELNLMCVMGGCEIIVPSNWEVEKRGAICIMGGFSNKTKCMAEELELPRKKLIIKGLALMGGGEVRN